MKIELATVLSSKKELQWLDFGLESILEKTNHNINTTLYLSRFSEDLFLECSRIANKYNINFEPRGDNSPLQYINEAKHRGFDINKADCVMSIQPDTFFLKKHVFDPIMEEASQYFDSNYIVCISSDHPDDTLPLGMTIHTKLGWETIGCEDINFYPHAGQESDTHRRCYLSYGLDPDDNVAYMKPLEGKVLPPWMHRIRNKNFMHIEKPWNTIDSRLGNKRQIDYTLQVFFNCVLCDRWGPYYIEKWGGQPGKESFTHPFNNENNTIKIEWKNSTNPYPETKFVSLRGLII